MWPIGHVAVAYLVSAGTRRIRSVQPPQEGIVVAACVAGLAPDLIDKPLSWQAGVLPTGRSLAHSLLILGPCCLLAYLIARRRGRGELGITVAVGAVSHPLVDAFPSLWQSGTASFLLWPVTSVDPYEGAPPGLFELLSSAAAEPYFVSEFVLFALAVWVWQREGAPGLPERVAG